MALNLVATLGRRFAEPVERLDSAHRLREWLDGVGLDPADPRSLTEEDVLRLRELREQIEILFRSVLASRRPPRAALEHVNAAAMQTHPQLRATRSGVALTATPDGALNAACALVAQDAIRILTGSERKRLRVCAADDCRMLYLPNGGRARRWCSSERCGNRSRVAAHRARAGAQSGQPR